MIWAQFIPFSCMLTLAWQSVTVTQESRSRVLFCVVKPVVFIPNPACWQKKTEGMEPSRVFTCSDSEHSHHMMQQSHIWAVPLLTLTASNCLSLHISTLREAIPPCCVSIKTAAEFGAHCSTSHGSSVAERCVDTAHRNNPTRFFIYCINDSLKNNFFWVFILFFDLYAEGLEGLSCVFRKEPLRWMCDIGLYRCTFLSVLSTGWTSH